MKLFLYIILSIFTTMPSNNTIIGGQELYVPMQNKNYSTSTYISNYRNTGKVYNYNTGKLYQSSNGKIRTSSFNGISYSNGEYSSVQSTNSTDVSLSVSVQAPSSKKTYTCPMCGGTGYINDNGNGELVTAWWWRQETGNAGDGTYCDGVEAYHDPCDADWSENGGTYHHDGKRVCPQCGGTGTVSSRRQPSVISGWVQWYGESWSHLYHDDDGDGHCDEHYWHKETPIGDVPIFFFLLLSGVCICYIRNKREE